MVQKDVDILIKRTITKQIQEQSNSLGQTFFKGGGSVTKWHKMLFLFYFFS